MCNSSDVPTALHLSTFRMFVLHYIAQTAVTENQTSQRGLVMAVWKHPVAILVSTDNMLVPARSVLEKVVLATVCVTGMAMWLVLF